GTFSSVHIKVVKVVAVPAGKEGLADNDAGLPVVANLGDGVDVNILNLHFIPQILGSTAVPAGNYTQLRLILAPNQPTLNNYVILTSAPDQKQPLTTPSAQQSGLKIVGNFTITAGALNTVLLDFNPNDAIVFAGNSGKIILKPTGIKLIQVYNSLDNAGAVSGVIRSPAFSKWSSAVLTVVPRNPAAGPVTAGVIFSNFSSPSVWKAPFTAFLPANGSSAVPSANYKVFVQATGSGGLQNGAFRLYSSPAFSVSSGVDTLVPPDGTVLLTP
ncbi:DUF4382 domain-containing protein, partial [Geomonas sp.]|uniref:DUF4382 domain-containing protein n=1 Tax=Geomonas sp. TaxID=2651584 RepID=UPI002B472A61